jgi:hypothetical protein
MAFSWLLGPAVAVPTACEAGPADSLLSAVTWRIAPTRGAMTASRLSRRRTPGTPPTTWLAFTF